MNARDVRLLRVSDLRGFQHAIGGRALEGGAAGASDRVVLVPTREAAHELRRTLLRAEPADGLVLPRLLTRGEFHVELLRRLDPPSPPLLTRTEREAIVWRASDEAIAAGVSPPFVVRPGLIVEMLALYDALRRNRREVIDFERVLEAALEPGAEADRGAARLLVQTRYLTATFRGYAAALSSLDRFDEHRLRDVVLERGPALPIRHVILTVADQAAEPDGLWPADFDLLARLPGLAHIDVVATAHALDAGFRDRLFEWLPGIEEMAPVVPFREPPDLLVSGEAGARSHHVHRDREEELRAIARHLEKVTLSNRELESVTFSKSDQAVLEDALVVYERPLPYLYLATRIFGDAGLAFTTADTLPLAAEPQAAAVDLVFEAAGSGCTRDALLHLLGSPLLSWRRDRRPLSPREHAALRDWLGERGYRGGRDELVAVIADLGRVPPGPAGVRLARAIEAAAAAAADLAVFERPQPLSAHLQNLAALLRRREARDAPSPRRDRARGAILDLLDQSGRAYAAHGDRVVPLREVASVVRRAIEEHTFAPATTDRGVRFVDGRAARYAEAGLVWIVGVQEGEWPASSRRSIFYPSSLLRDLGFAREADRLPFARAAFRDLVFLARQQTAVSAFQLEDDAIVRGSVLLEDLEDMPLARRACSPPDGDGHTTPVAAGARSPDDPTDPGPAALARVRAGRDPGDPRLHGQAGPPAPRVLSVTQIERFLECPFKFFASVVLAVPEDEDDRLEVGLDPRRRGTLVHEVFQDFFEHWTSEGHGTITPAALPAARAIFGEVVARALDGLADADRVIEGTRLLGSGTGPGLGERVFRLEASRPERVVERLLEFDLRGTYRFGETAPVTVTLKGVADRIDLLSDGTLRLIDYKTGRAPDPDRSIQLAVYVLCAEQRLDGYRGRRWRAGEAAYVALGDRRPWVAAMEGPGDRARIEAGRERFLSALDGIAQGRFPPAPADRRSCLVCAFAPVCRKDYVDGAA